MVMIFLRHRPGHHPSLAKRAQGCPPKLSAKAGRVPRASAGKPLSPFAREAGARLPAEAFSEGGPCAASFGWQVTFALRLRSGRGHARPTAIPRLNFGFEFQTAIPSRSRRAFSRESCSEHPTLCRLRARGMPGARCARSLVCEMMKAHKYSHHGHTGITRHSPRDGFNGFLRALPGDRAFLPPSSRG
jgi:hypothetical protein